MKPKRFALVIGLALVWLVVGTAGVAYADDLTVCSDGPPACDYSVIQDAVDAAAPGDTVKVATGVYTGTQGRPAPAGYDGPSVITQVVYISKTVTVRGGYTVDFVEPPDPEVNPTTLDAQGGGRVVFIGGDISPTVEGLRITGGDATGLGGGPAGDAGGGVYSITATVTLSGSWIYTNTVNGYGDGYGGGIFLISGSATLNANTILSNGLPDAQRGGGLYLENSYAALIDNTIAANGSGFGGGLYGLHVTATLNNNQIFDNLGSVGVGIYLEESTATLVSNTIHSNGWASWGGGVCLLRSNALLDGNTIAANSGYNGAGLQAEHSNVTFVDNIISDNLGEEGAGLLFWNSEIVLNHNTIARNTVSLYEGGCGGLVVYGSNATLNANLIISNSSWIAAGGLCIGDRSSATLTANVIVSNTTEDGIGGGLSLSSSDFVLTGNTIAHNSAQNGGGLSLSGADATLINNIIADNQAYEGGGLYIVGSTARLFYNTIARNTEGSGSGIYVTPRYPGRASTVWLTNTILVSHTVGIRVTAGNTVTLDATLWGNDTDWAGSGSIITGTLNWWGDPAFLDPAAGDYHIGPASAALNQGIATTVLTDIDHQLRDAQPDLGADEYVVSDCWARLNDGTIYTSVQAAVDASDQPGDLVKVAGYCAEVNDYGGLAQVVYVSKTLTVRGGYTVTNWSDPDPVANPTTLDGLGEGRVMYIAGEISPTVEGLRITGGDAAGLGGGPAGRDAGGGVYAITATTIFSGNLVFSNTVNWYGGGLFLGYGNTILNNNVITANTGWGGGGGVYGISVTATLDNNAVFDNLADTGGGLHLSSSDVTLYHNIIATNTCWYQGGGVYLSDSNVSLSANTVSNNTAEFGGGLYLSHSIAWVYTNTVNNNVASLNGPGLSLSHCEATFDGNVISSNADTGDYSWVLGGGVYLEHSQAAFYNNVIISNSLQNSDSDGGGLYADQSTLVLDKNTIANNDAQRFGGGLSTYRGTLTLTQNLIVTNSVSQAGGGLNLLESDAVLDRNTISHNFAKDDGGGLTLWSIEGRGAFTLTNNLISHNTNLLLFGGGLTLYNNSGLPTSLIGNTIISNTGRLGGGLALAGGELPGGAPTLVNNLIANNQVSASGQGSGLFIIGGTTPRLFHNTIANNIGGDGSGIYVSQFGGPGTAWLTNTILVSHTVGIAVEAGCTATLNATLWGNGTDWAGSGTIITGTLNYWGDPDFVDPIAGDYHIGPASAALDVGIDAGILSDIDGDPRPIGLAPDLGADEYTAGLSLTKRAHLPIVQAGSQLTYTLHLTNTGIVTLTITITDLLPAQVAPTGLVTWTLPPLAPGDTWTHTIAVIVAWGYSGTLTNILRATTLEGPTGVYTETSQAQTTPALALTKRAQPDPVQAGAQLTYTLSLTNTGNAALTATITDFLPDHVSPGGVLTWTASLPAPGGTWSQVVVVTVEPGYSGTLTNVLQVATQEGVTGAYTETSEVVLTPPDVPALLFPPNGYITTTQAISLAWAAGEGNPPTGYNLDLDGAIVTTTDTAWPTVLPLGIHTWTVRAFNQAGYSDWATPWTVEVTQTLPPPGIPVLLWPPDGTVTTTQAITLAWQAGPGAPPTGYNLDLDGDIVTTTATISPAILPLGVHTWTVRAFNQAGYSAWADVWTVEITQTPPCTQVTGVALTQVTTGTIYAGDTVQFSADLAPDDAAKPYTYTVLLDGEEIIPPTGSSADPLPFSHTFPSTGTYTVEMAVWNCAMAQASAVTSSVQVTVYQPGVCVPLETITVLGEVTGYLGRPYTFTTQYAPTGASHPISYTWDDGGTGASSRRTFEVTGSHRLTVTAANCGGIPVEDEHVIVIEEEPVCVELSGVDLSLVGGGSLYLGDTAQFSADLMPDEATKPYSYTIDYGDGSGLVWGSGSDDPFGFSYTYPATGTYTVAFEAWNCEMAVPVTGTVQVEVGRPGPEGYAVYLPVVMRDS